MMGFDWRSHQPGWHREGQGHSICPFRTKIEDISHLASPVLAFVCTGTTCVSRILHIGKPRKRMQLGCPGELGRVHLVGDAAGGAKKVEAKDKQRTFMWRPDVCHQPGTKFFTPEEFSWARTWCFGLGCPKPSTDYGRLGDRVDDSHIIREEPELAILVGPPATWEEHIQPPILNHVVTSG